ncbi:hypothetical protein GCM10025868_45360 [Angustibacter aerolatus]|uniref:DUF222 domain-containing protein n=1 Tax=Angustibacter aerolatus TaxID=1162965 RepID=A0ABQ6JRH7_9ACTN|nr:hypothetical protein [Angustibacter aerolatus]GMA89286.1 hypothetical protein GCM10025868_45360 [Angustibacter aerolatus]
MLTRLDPAANRLLTHLTGVPESALSATRLLGALPLFDEPGLAGSPAWRHRLEGAAVVGGGAFGGATGDALRSRLALLAGPGGSLDVLRRTARTQRSAVGQVADATREQEVMRIVMLHLLLAEPAEGDHDGEPGGRRGLPGDPAGWPVRCCASLRSA